eukprot:TRINITY_DN10782_c0_g1_i1.p1 TRINITY_DN10782_c0_g1~~TRINITY_DN10782_c0_g1_i1.p1  ORF type:complete len:203 (-),score=24.89 TRINITY_DN10782_c0_g1_i1:56-664(-)
MCFFEIRSPKQIIKKSNYNYYYKQQDYHTCKNLKYQCIKLQMHEIKQNQRSFYTGNEHGYSNAQLTSIKPCNSNGNCCKKKQQNQYNTMCSVAGYMCISVLHFIQSLGYKIQKREKENPDQVNQMPVQTSIFQMLKISRIYIIIFYLYNYITYQCHPHVLCVDTVSYTHLTLPTICSVQISVVAVSLKKKNNNNECLYVLVY